MESRRDFLKKAAFFSGAGLAAPLFDSIQKALAIEPTPGSTFWDAEHVVILMQENRSFDHAYGTLRGVRGFNDPRALRLPNGNPVWVQTSSNGESYAPFRLGMNETRSTWMGCLPHNWTDQVDARHGGRYDRWIDCKKSGEEAFANMPLTMGFYNREDIPFYYELADAFTICDQNFCSTLTGTTPNRLHLWTGTIRAEQSAKAWAHVLNSDADYATEVDWPTFPERLEDLGVSWKIYQNELSVGVGFQGDEEPWLANFGDNPIEYFRQFNVRMSRAYRDHLESTSKSLEAEVDALKRSTSVESAAALAKKSTELQEILAARELWNQSNYDQLSARDKSLHAKAFCTNVGDPDYHQLTEIEYREGDTIRRVQVPKGDLLYQFRKDVAEGTLPTVSWVVPPERFSDHPCSAWFGAWYLAEMLEILTHNPDVWKKTIFILTYDENDGYFDHVPPFVSPDPRRSDSGKVSASIDASLEFVTREQELERKPPEECRDSAMGLGYRVPLVIASPWTRGGCVCSQVFDHTSPLQFLEKLLSHKLGKPVHEPNINEWRRTVCGDLTSAFQDTTAVDSPLSVVERNAFIEQIHRAQFKELPTGYHRLTDADIEEIRRDAHASPHLPKQEPGVRRSCPLPYELAVDGMLTDDGKAFQIEFSAGNARFGPIAAGSPFIVYARRGGEDLEVRNYAVAAGDRLADSWLLAEFPTATFHLEVFGPNGFFRLFQGDAKSSTLQVEMSEQLSLTNRGPSPLDIKIIDLAYQGRPQSFTLAAGEAKSCPIRTEESQGWYDFAIRIAGYTQFEQRYAGRIETGKWSTSDPAMGRT